MYVHYTMQIVGTSSLSLNRDDNRNLTYKLLVATGCGELKYCRLVSCRSSSNLGYELNGSRVRNVGRLTYILLVRAAPEICLYHRKSKKEKKSYNFSKVFFANLCDFWQKRTHSSALLMKLLIANLFCNHQNKNERRSCFAHHSVSALVSARSVSGALELVANQYIVHTQVRM